jgi:UDP-glucuronate decarboxylase
MGSQISKDIQYTYTSLSDNEKDSLRNSTILITGACGFLGDYFLRFFQQMG